MDHQHIEDSKGGTRYDEEVAGDDGRCVILEKHPAVSQPG